MVFPFSMKMLKLQSQNHYMMFGKKNKKIVISYMLKKQTMQLNVIVQYMMKMIYTL